MWETEVFAPRKEKRNWALWKGEGTCPGKGWHGTPWYCLWREGAEIGARIFFRGENAQKEKFFNVGKRRGLKPRTQGSPTLKMKYPHSSEERNEPSGPEGEV